MRKRILKTEMQKNIYGLTARLHFSFCSFSQKNIESCKPVYFPSDYIEIKQKVGGNPYKRLSMSLSYLTTYFKNLLCRPLQQVTGQVPSVAQNYVVFKPKHMPVLGRGLQ
jgi:hypothetical protein